ncbi:hypothetical protein BEL04_11500 [Mucilaginibacter sp. PPCGB 2223]|uniref:tetratricopeptide repeat-containing sensor histidine kinase n=1 Tax=Mucilaginibacter sp. PPCGB 2223 TaxID=1886027 RepID=UPI0008267539|nr:histidine kinase dimerization/phosphoacceptor domain -containing protein [Mucilaginibacter sp. PPCGB 2223]OCX52114.1 hypothetical protein BEL04_11500 [Mucilaginibacter sp. PPCGB 2223]
MKNARIWLITIVIILARYPAAGQALTPTVHNPYTVKAMLRNNPSDSLRVDLIQQLGSFQLLKPGGEKINLDSGLNYYLYALKLCDSLKLRINNRYEAMLRVGEAYFRLKNFEVGKRYFNSVVKAYQLAGDKKREARTWLRFAIKLKMGNGARPEIIGCLNKALALYRQLGDVGKQAEALMEKGIVYRLRIKLDSAETNLLASLKLYITTRSPELTRLYFQLSLVYRNTGDLSKALAYILKTLDDAKMRGDTLKYLQQSEYYGQLGYVYADLNNPEASLKSYRKSIQLSTTNNVNHITSDITYLHLNELMRESLVINQGKQALAEIQQVINEYPPVDSIQRGHQAEIMGLYYNDLKQFDKAEAYFKKMVKYYHSEVIDESWGNKILASFYIAQKKYKPARTYLDKEFRNIDTRSQAYLNAVEDEMFYYKIDSAKGNFVSALEHFRKFKQKNDSAFGVAKSKEIAEVEARYETSKKEAAITSLQKDRQLLTKQVTQATYIRNLTIGGVVLLIAFIAVLYNSYRFKQRKNDKLNELLQEKDNLLVEKEWLLREIHHRVKNNLQIVIGLLQRQLSYTDNHVALSAIQNSENRMHSIALIHQKLYQSDILDLIGMPEYVNDLVQHLKDSFDLGSRINFEKHVDEVSLDVSQAVPLGLILNEAITNAIKYAYPEQQPGTILIYLTMKSPEEVTLLIKDNGIGLPKGFNLEKIDSMGMNLMRGLSKQLCGSFDIASDNGVSIAISFKTESFTTTQTV